MPLVYRKNSDIAAFIGARTIHSPKEYEDADANENSELSTRLPYVFAISRFAHSLKCIARDKVGTFKSRTDNKLLLDFKTELGHLELEVSTLDTLNPLSMKLYENLCS